MVSSSGSAVSTHCELVRVLKAPVDVYARSAVILHFHMVQKVSDGHTDLSDATQNLSYSATLMGQTIM